MHWHIFNMMQCMQGESTNHRWKPGRKITKYLSCFLYAFPEHVLLTTAGNSRSSVDESLV